MDQDAIFQALKDIIADELHVSKDAVAPTTKFVADGDDDGNDCLAVDSLGMSSMAQAMEDRFGIDSIPDEDVMEWATVQNAVEYVASRI